MSKHEFEAEVENGVSCEVCGNHWSHPNHNAPSSPVKSSPKYPWTLLKDDVTRRYFITSSKEPPFGADICYGIERKEDGEKIIQAVNSHVLLIEAVEAALKYLKDELAVQSIVDKLEAALKAVSK